MSLAWFMSLLAAFATLTLVAMMIRVNEARYEERAALVARRVGQRRPPSQAPPSPTRAPPEGPIEDRITHLLHRARLPLTPAQFLLLCGAAGITGWLAVSMLSTRWALWGVAAAALPFFAARYLGAQVQRRMLDQLPSALETMISSLRGGRTLPQALEQAAREASSPLAEELRNASERTRLGADLREVLASARERTPAFHEFHYLLRILEIQQRTGGDLIQMLARLKDGQRALRAAEQRIAAASAEGRTTALILFGLPVLVGLALLLFLPSYLFRLFADPMGRSVLGLSTLWLFTGALLATRLTRWEQS